MHFKLELAWVHSPVGYDVALTRRRSRVRIPVDPSLHRAWNPATNSNISLKKHMPVLKDIVLIKITTDTYTELSKVMNQMQTRRSELVSAEDALRELLEYYKKKA
jgi:hypothetical protein